MYKYKVEIRKVSGVLTESVFPNKNLVVKSKSQLNENTLYNKVADFYEKKYGLVVEEFSVSGFDNEEPSNVTTGNTQGVASFNKPTTKRRGRPVGSKNQPAAEPKR